MDEWVMAVFNGRMGKGCLRWTSGQGLLLGNIGCDAVDLPGPVSAESTDGRPTKNPRPTGPTPVHFRQPMRIYGRQELWTCLQFGLFRKILDL